MSLWDRLDDLEWWAMTFADRWLFVFIFVMSLALFSFTLVQGQGWYAVGFGTIALAALKGIRD